MDEDCGTNSQTQKRRTSGLAPVLLGQQSTNFSRKPESVASLGSATKKKKGVSDFAARELHQKAVAHLPLICKGNSLNIGTSGAESDAFGSFIWPQFLLAEVPIKSLSGSGVGKYLHEVIGSFQT